MAEFIAQEEMNRNTGYWWSPDERHIAYTRVDESPVAEVERFEIDAEGVRVFKQRYPVTGQANADVKLAILALDSGAVAWADLGANDHYLARVAWFPGKRPPAGAAPVTRPEAARRIVVSRHRRRRPADVLRAQRYLGIAA